MQNKRMQWNSLGRNLIAALEAARDEEKDEEFRGIVSKWRTEGGYPGSGKAHLEGRVTIETMTSDGLDVQVGSHRDLV